MGRIPKKEKGTQMMGLHLDKELQERLEKKCLELGKSKREYVQELIMKDLGLRYVPAHYEEIL